MKSADRIDLLETFVCVVEEGALSRAAGRLGVSQPSVSRRIRQLEDLVGSRLLHRTTHSLSLTDEGHRLLVLAKHLLGSWEAGLDELRDTEPQGLLRVAAPVGLGQSVLVDAAAEFLAENRKVEIDWRLTDHDIDLMSGEADIWIRIGVTTDDRFVSRRLAVAERLLVASPTLAAQTPKWWRHPVIALTPFFRGSVELFDRHGVSHQHSPRVALRTDNIEAARRAALRGVGAAILPTWLIKSDLAAGALVDAAPGLKAASLDVTLAYAPERGRPMRLTRFVDYITNQLSALG
ncbi:MAG: LysR family transcriptional regulator [Pseudomonadota bacterium]